MRCDTTLKLDIAERFRHDAFYFPYNVDFRGRAYPLPPNLNHLGSDVCRAVLQFAEPKRLGDDGLYWLRVHLANLFGLAKRSLEERHQFALDRHDAFYFPYNVDFRGRAYPLPPNLNHLGSDVCRAVLQFAEPKRLGDDGLYWLLSLIHI